MGRFETPFETPASARPPGGPPPAPHQSFDRVPDRADSHKKYLRDRSGRRSLKAFPEPSVRPSCLLFDHLITQVIAEISRG